MFIEFGKPLYNRLLRFIQDTKITQVYGMYFRAPARCDFVYRALKISVVEDMYQVALLDGDYVDQL